MDTSGEEISNEDVPSMSQSQHSRIFTEMEEMEAYLPNLKISLENPDRNIRMETVEVALNKYLPYCSPNILDEKLFAIILPTVHQLFFETIDEIDEILTDVSLNDLDDVKARLQACDDLLNCWEKCSKHVKDLHKVSASDLKTFLEILPEVLKRSFEHCKVSESTYGIILNETTSELTSLFRKTNAIQTLFFATLEKVIIFDSNVEVEMNVLQKAINIIGDIGSLVNGMDLKTLVEVWIVFGTLASAHCKDIKLTSPSCVTSHLEFIANNVTTLLHSAIQVSDGKSDERLVKCASIFFKILDKVCASYFEYLDKDVIVNLVQMLVQLHRYSPSCLKLMNVNAKTIDYVRVSVSIGLEPFLNTIIKHTDFKQTFFEYSKLEKVDRIGYHLLTLSVMRKLIDMPDEACCTWLENPIVILDIALRNINYLQEELCVGQLRLQGFHALGERPYHISLYEATLVPICGMISRVPVSEFNAIEVHLLKHLLGGEFWSSLLASDVWCFIGRLGSSKLCYHHLKYLMKVHGLLAQRENSLEVVMLSNLIGRLYSLLPEEMKETLVDDFDSDDPRLWTPVARLLSSEAKSVLYKRASVDISVISTILSDLEQRPSGKKWTSLISELKKLGAFGEEQDEKTVNILSGIWSRVTRAMEESEGVQLNLLSELMIVLFDGIHPDKVYNEIFISIFSNIISLIPYVASHLRIKMAHYVEKNINIFTDCGSNVAAMIAELYCCLLEDESPWVRQEAFESFDFAAHMCPSEELVTKIVSAVAERPLICDSLPPYLSNTLYYKLAGFLSVDAYLRELVQRTKDIFTQHTCYQRDVQERIDKRPKLEILTEEPSRNLATLEFKKRVDRLCDDMDYILKQKDNISQDVLEKLRRSVIKILD